MRGMNARAVRLAGAMGFTLIELLVVIAVIAIMAALLLPALGKARDFSKSAKCQSNLKQATLAMLSYSGDFAEWVPSMKALNNEWGDGVYNQTFWGYLMASLFYAPEQKQGRSILQCPSIPIFGSKYTYTYGMRGNMSSPSVAVYFKLAANVRDSQGTVYSDSPSLMPMLFDDINWDGSHYTMYASPNREQFCFAHGLRGNSSFFDGHAASVNTKCGYFTKGRDPITGLEIVNPLPSP